MTRIEVSRELGVAPSEAWAALADLGSHAEWMKDARRIVFVGEQTRGMGTLMEVETRVGPLRTVDRLEVTGWVEGSSIEVAHRGLVTGTGTLSVRARGTGSEVSWLEDLAFPWWLGGAIAGWLARPILAAVWRGNLRRLEEGLSSR